MRFIKLEISPEDLIRRNKKEEGAKIVKCVQGEDEHDWRMPKDGYDMTVDEQDCLRCGVKRKAWIEAMNSQGLLCGDKGLIVHFLEDLIRPGDAKDLRRWLRISDLVKKAEDPGWLKLEEDDWDWFKKKFTNIDFDATRKDRDGRELPVFNKFVMEMLGRVIIKIEEATDKEPEKEAA